MTIKESIRAVLLGGGQVGWPYKEGQRDWFMTVRLSYVCPTKKSEPKSRYMCTDGPRDFQIDTTDVDEAVDQYCKLVFNKKNTGLAYRGIYFHGLATTRDLEEFSPQRTSALVQKYWREYFHLDFPEFANQES